MRVEIRRSVWYFAFVPLLVLFPFVNQLFEPGWNVGKGVALGALVLGVVSFVFRSAHNDPVVVLDDDGLRDSRWGLSQPVAWSDVRRVSPSGIREISLYLETPLDQKPANSGSLRSTEESRSRLDTHAWGLQVSFDELVRLIRERVDEARL